MSRRSLKRSGGFSIVAAFVFAAILAAVAALVQMTLPPTTVFPSSQGADVAATQTTAPQTDTTSKSSQTTQVCELGYDYSITINKTTGEVGKPEKFEICPKEPLSANIQMPKDRVACSDAGEATTVKAQQGICDYRFKNPLTEAGTMGAYILRETWKCKNRFIDTSIEDPKRKCYIQESPFGSAPSGVAPAPVTDFGTNTGGASNSTCKSNPLWSAAWGPCPTDSDPTAPEVAQPARTLDEAWSTKNEADAAVKECESDPKKCSQTEYDSRLDSQIDANIRLQEMAEQRLDYCNSTQGAGQGIECTKDEYKKLDEAKTAALNGLKDEQAGPSAPGQQPGPRTPAGQPAPGASTRGPGIFPTQASGPANNFGNPAMGQNGGPASPFGGQCTSGYVCQGNTLYWQSPSNYNGSASCMTQPYQQCQFGCQQPYGAVQPGQQQTTVGTIQQWLPVVQSVLSLFGGGNNNNSMVNPNLSRSCATQPQQSPYGTGTNGQPCYQPPQQPPQSQCTSGTWQPISGSQNGCTTGWQCVPNGSNGTNSGAPTAQLSCQPKVADVGMQIGFSWSCGNSTGSAGTGFDTNGQLSGNTTAVAPQPPADSNNTATYTLTCINQGVTASSQCQVQLGKPGIVLVTNPKQVKSGDTALIGWVTAGMKSCVISSPDQQDFTQKNAGSSNVNGGVTSSPITKDTTFRLDCETIGGQTKSASAVVTIN